MPAIHVSDTGDFRNPHYHAPTDTPETIDFEQLRTIIAATALTVDALSRAEPGQPWP
jgi:hypothetical protein